MAKAKNTEIVQESVTHALPVDPNRAAIELQRGIVRNEKGEIVRTPAQKKERIAYLEKKIEDFATRIKNAKALIKELQK